jgi:hypothetical protein
MLACPRLSWPFAFLLSLCASIAGARASDLCPDEQSTRQLPPPSNTCTALDPVVRRPSTLPLDQYESRLNEFFGQYCHRRLDAGWGMDKTVRDTGPFIATQQTDGTYSTTYNGTHQPVLVWYSPEMMAWLRANRPVDGTRTPKTAAPVPDGAIIVKEMYNSQPAAACRVPDLLKLKPVEQGAAVMIRDRAASKDGWFWGWYGWPDTGSGWSVDYPPKQGNPPPGMGFGQYCANCHASARDDLTFSALGNIRGEHGTFLPFLSQNYYQLQTFGKDEPVVPLKAAPPPMRQLVDVHRRAIMAPPPEKRTRSPGQIFLSDLGLRAMPASTTGLIPGNQIMPSMTYDNVWVPGHGASANGTFTTSDQCLGCHTAGGTGLQYDMTAPVPGSASLMYNFSPYGTWRTSPMGLAGRDPVFFAMLASETQTFHPAASPEVQGVCLGCHGIMGERQFHIDDQSGSAHCTDFLRATVDAVPWPPTTELAKSSRFGGLARDGISCATCHHMVLGKSDSARYANQPQNRCVNERQALLNPDLSGFARTFTGSFFVGPPDRIYGPFQDPKQKPMRNAMGILPEHGIALTTSEACGTCHTVHLPVMRDGETIGHTYEQTTYPEWAFSAYRTGDSPDGKLPFGPGTRARSCQDCHMPKADASGNPFVSRIAGIQEHSTFPAVENGLPAEDIDLPARSGFAKHSLVGLNVFLIEMAKQFDDVLGIRKYDPMMGSYGVPPLDLTLRAMLTQASKATAEISVTEALVGPDGLSATVRVTNNTGHKFPSGVGFRRAFVDFRVADAAGKVLWESGRTNDAGVLVDQDGKPVAGENWWKEDCSERLNGPGNNPHQPHYREISRQDQVQIFQELVTAPSSTATEQCGRGAKPLGQLTTSFLSICAPLKDNRLLPDGFLPLEQRVAISRALGADPEMAEDSGPVGTGDDPAYLTGGGDTFRYRIPAADLAGAPSNVTAVLYYQATPPFFLQDRFCTAKGADRDRLLTVTSRLDLNGTRAEKWKLDVVGSGSVAVTGR